MIQHCYLSIVAPSRNDDHGGSLLRRMQIFVSGLIEQCRRHHLNAELIIVEWNPPPERPKLAEALSYPSDLGPCQVRIIEVPNEIHRRFQHSDKLPLFQMIAKNVGIRRAKGKFVLATNIDILFSDDLMRFLASKALLEGHLYRVDRYDVDPSIPAMPPIDQKLEYCMKHLTRINYRNGTCNLKTDESSDFYRLIERVPYPVDRVVLKLYRNCLKSGKEMMQSIRGWLSGNNIIKLIERIQERTQERIQERVIPDLHSNACGDFTLMSREDWFNLKGYAELEIYSFHLDSLLCYCAYYNGIKEIILEDPMRIYHIDHSAGWSPEGADELHERLKRIGLPELSHQQLKSYALQMHQQRKPIFFNDENWGLAGENLKETTDNDFK